ncbi:hypothetical protein A9Q99_17805 [Gammaproteobacteria bacterium 45_16_T64]|nr:hypothetical protein A9Q99_17805 [Gammaproteobacteria bacterium 45_16_T64]
MPSADQLKVFNDIASSALDDLTLSLQGSSDPINVQSCRDSFEDLAMAAEIIEFGTLGDICKTYSDSFFDNENEDILSPKKSQELAEWSQDLISFIKDPHSVELAEKITTSFPEPTKNRFLTSLFSEDQSQQEDVLSDNAPTLSDSAEAPSDITLEEEVQHVIDVALTAAPNDTMVLFITELTEMESKLDDSLSAFLTCPEEECIDNLDRYLRYIEMISGTANILGMAGIEVICQFVIDNIPALDLFDEEKKPDYFELLSPIPRKIITLLSNIGDTQNILDIVTHFEKPLWPNPNQEADSHELVVLLSATDFEIEDKEFEDPEKSIATAEDVSLTISPEIHPELISAFLHDAPGQASALSHCISCLATDDDIIDHLENAQRLTHSLKGSANIVEIYGVANLAHYVEEILEDLRHYPDRLSSSLLSLLEESSDCIEVMIDFLMGKDQYPEESQYLLQQLLDQKNGSLAISSVEGETQDDASQSMITYLTVAKPDEYISDESTSTDQYDLSSTEITSNPGIQNPSGTDPSTTAPVIAEEQSVPKTQPQPQDTVIQVSSKTIESLFEMVEEMTVSLIQTREQVKKMLTNAKTQTSQDEKIQEHRFELEKIIDIKALSSSKKRISNQEGDENSFDSLELDQYSEIHGTVHSFIETVIDSRELNLDMQEQLLHLDSLFIKHMRLNKDLQFLTKSTKMVAVTSISSRLQRCVRHAVRVTGKQVELSIIDNNLSVDEEVLSELTDPLMHILRNAIDHGIEDSSIRRELGKNDDGHISITFSQSGNHISIKCHDDGQGIRPHIIFDAAVKKGLIKPDAKMDDQQCVDLLLSSGFTTKESANQLSGRGVGLDAVNTSIKKLSGKIEITTEESQGTTICVTVPLSHLSTHAIVISLNYERYAIPSHSLSQLLPPHSGEVVNYGLKEGYRYNDSVYPLVTIGDLLLGNQSGNKQHITIDNLPILLVEVNHTTYALAVDSIQSNQDIIIKPMGNYVNRTHGVNGVAIIADGTLIPVLDIPELIRDTKDSPIINYIEQQQHTAPLSHQTSVMIIDDSLSVRRSLDQLMTDMGYDTILAQDGVQAVELLKHQIPDVILTDMEMPRMNGLELTSYIKKSETLRHLPVVMITSRSTQKHRQLAESSGVDHYLTKPYTESQLLDLVENIKPDQANPRQLH